MISHNGQSLTIAEWARRIGMDKSTLHRRLARGMSVAEALTPPERPLPMTNRRFGRLLVVSEAASGARGARWNCVCNCGGKRVAYAADLRSGHTQSCGCLFLEKLAEGARARTFRPPGWKKAYYIWRGIMRRCYDKNNPAYKDYGGRGIKVCKRWHKPENYYADVGDKPVGKTSDRIDNSKSYSPKNHRWATPSEQAKNRRDNVWITYAGETMILADWARKYGVAASTFSFYLNLYGAEKAIAFCSGKIRSPNGKMRTQQVQP